MGTTIYVTAIILALSCLNSCQQFSSNYHMAIKNPGARLAHVPGKAAVIFEKESGGTYSASFWDVTDREKPSVVAVLAPTMKAAHFIQPGEYFFLSVVAGRRSLVRVNAAADRTYCLNFDGTLFVPIKQGRTHPIDFKDFSVMLPAGDAWANRPRTINSVKRHAAKAYSSWSKLTEEERNPLVLEADETCRSMPEA